MSLEKTLEERGTQYGSFYEQSSIACSIKDVLQRGKGWQRLAPDQRESFEMIAVKMARILNGNPDNFDSWFDIAGYAQLVANRLK